MATSTLHPMASVAIKAARAAGDTIHRAAPNVESIRVSQKQGNDFVTEVDQAAEQLIIDILLDAYPAHGIWAEESGRERGNPDATSVWIIDPLDGTMNFLHGLPVYCVSIALLVRQRVELGVIYDPTRNDLFIAARGRGAFKNQQRLRVSKRTHLKTCLLSTGFPFRPGDDVPTYLRMMGDMIVRSSGMRRLGSAALDLAYVAAGYTDGFFEKGLQSWDVAAGSLLVQEAGGLVGNFSGDAAFLEQRECVAASPRIYAQMVAVLRSYSAVGKQPVASGEPRPSMEASSLAPLLPASVPTAPLATETTTAETLPAESSSAQPSSAAPAVEHGVPQPGIDTPPAVRDAPW
ncbi:inositol monophosphatase family protein [Candidatus Symbiobacter mobilis]|nr:inositol monophosphatase family protein [Candidatus Symbiobacter mobilis]